jgi:diacylglycerol kinase family enzyme
LVVFLNPRCNYGTGRVRWERVRDGVQERTGPFEFVETSSPEELAFRVGEAARSGERVLVAAGGDGSVNLLLNTVIAAGLGPDTTIGAVGLGSSNDFHKPFRPEALVRGTPVRVDAAGGKPCDVIRVEYTGRDGQRSTRFCMLNASVGVTAEANAYFNSRHRFIELLQQLSVNLVISATALRTVLAFRAIRCRVEVDRADEEQFDVTNLGVVKNPHFAGSFCYDSPVKPDDGRIGVNLCWGLSRVRMAAMLAALQRGEFSGRPKTRTWLAREAAVESDESFALEMDGEVVQARGARFSVVPQRVRCCR